MKLFPPAAPAALLALAGPLFADVIACEVEVRRPVQEGHVFGTAGPYELLEGTLHFAFDPADEANAAVVDIDRAPLDAEGRVHASTRFEVLRPVDLERGSGTVLVEVSNRGGRAALSYFNGGNNGADVASERFAGDGFLMRRGLTVVWLGWQWDVPDEPGRLRLDVPAAEGGLEGLVRCDWTLDRPARRLELGHRSHRSYAPVRRDDERVVLTSRDGRLAERTVVPREEWSFDGDAHIESLVDGGFTAGKIYELVYVARDPKLVGLGLAAIRDVVSFAKYDDDCPFPGERGLAVGISQTGRFLRHFLYQGFNTDEESRQAYDGFLIHTAGAGRGSFNHRFAQPSRDAHRYSAFFYPTDVFPFSGRTQRDPLTGAVDGLLAQLGDDHPAPKVFYTNTGYEYWGRAASLLHTSLDGSADVEPLPNERIYHLSSTQHFSVSGPAIRSRPWDGPLPRRGNPADILGTERALLAALQEWVEHGIEPPPSAYPRIDAGTLVPIAGVAFPKLSGVELPGVIHEAYRVDYGPEWSAGIVANQPPVLGPAFATLVSQVDALGNEVGGVPCLDVLAPLATYAPWNVRRGMAGGEGELTDFYGTYVPLCRTAEERENARDPRPSVEEMYGTRAAFLEFAETRARELVAARTLLEEDVERALARAAEHWDWITAP